MNETKPRQAGSGRAIAVAALALVVATVAFVRTCGDEPSGTTTVVRQAPGTAGAPAKARSSTLKLQSQLIGAPVGANANSAPGSQMVFSGMLFTPTGKAAIGRSQGACLRTAPGKGPVFQCQLTFVFRGGEIHAQSVASFQGPADGVVTGGTKHYANLRGTFRYQATGKSRVDLTFTLLS